MPRRFLTALGAIAVLSVFLADAEASVIRYLNASPDAPALDTRVDGLASPTSSNLSFGNLSAYGSRTPGTTQFQVVPAGATLPVLIDTTQNVVAGTAYSFVMAGKLASIGPVLFTDQPISNSPGVASIRLAHLSPDMPALSFSVVGGPTLASNVSFKSASGYGDLTGGAYDLQITVAGTSTVVGSLSNQILQAGSAYTFWVIGLAAGSPAVQEFVSNDTAAIAAVPEPGSIALLGLGALVLMPRTRRRA